MRLVAATNVHSRTWRKVIALTILVGALPFLDCMHARANEHVGLTYGAQATLQTTYLWRGLYAGGANIQASADVGYGGLYGLMWWNIGTTDWSFTKFEPEVDLILGFKRWGVNVSVVYIYNFNCGFFDFSPYPDKGNRLEINASYTVSDRIPLTILWASRVAAADHYINAAGDTVRAYSSYAQISYTHKMPQGWSLYGAVGITPWKSVYTLFERDFAVQNIELRVSKAWDLSTHCGMMVQGTVSLNPSALAADKTTIAWHPLSPGRQSLNANIGLCVYLQ